MTDHEIGDDITSMGAGRGGDNRSVDRFAYGNGERGSGPRSSDRVRIEPVADAIAMGARGSCSASARPTGRHPAVSRSQDEGLNKKGRLRDSPTTAAMVSTNSTRGRAHGTRPGETSHRRVVGARLRKIHGVAIKTLCRRTLQGERSSMNHHL